MSSKTAFNTTSLAFRYFDKKLKKQSYKQYSCGHASRPAGILEGMQAFLKAGRQEILQVGK